MQDGTLELDREVASYWPEFAAEGKGAVTLRELLAHRAGIVGADTGFTAGELADDRVTPSGWRASGRSGGRVRPSAITPW
ncbi:hypothetical protein AQJ43_15155 [Streptomyces avermitilis]|uniref:Esterase n=2 Tax=Streptomyces avermitilis TaxID=33903 RepID=Q82BC7_STRAW|nr:hypothetical protein AQJ43_15155 [Streptomyces avermitilis]BAC73490.1 putative esterase [Streptomyces avermitilis MA-4680 = NBRC 14893]OOV30939.1 hypothetical protein SM007_17385 [Streptomyces avermitilis]BBJ53967.1 hypothetical protein SAVMC3_65960 [Streptomyces avermitilis]GDY65977.1 hypothetical protein SAV14893_053700 [Streptomyces avermitilis]